MDEAKLVAGLKCRDPVAIEESIAAHGQRLLRSAFLLCGNQSDAEDLVQDTIVEALRSIHRFRGQSSLYTWFHSILLNLARHHHRDGKRIVYDNDAADREVAEPREHGSEMDAELANSELMRALQRLSHPHREIILLRYYKHMKMREIAARLGVSKGTAKSRLHYAIQQMQTLLPAEMNLFGGGGTKQTEAT